MSCRAGYLDLSRRAAGGANAKTGRAMGLAIAPALLLRAAEVIP